MFLKDGVYIKGIMEYDLDAAQWRFSHQRRNGLEIWGCELPNFAREFQKFIDDGSLVPGWHTKSHFLKAGQASHVSATLLTSNVPPGSVKKALSPKNVDRLIWEESYQEEYSGLESNDTFVIISQEEHQRLYRLSGKRAIPSMCVFTIKKDAFGNPVRAKSRIVVLGNKDPTEWTKADCFAPVVSLPTVRMLTALVIQHQRILKQGDCKNAFVQADLPDKEVTVVKPPAGCPCSGLGAYWRLKKSLYGLKRAPKHWYNLISSILISPEIGLQRCKNDPCVFFGTILPGKPPLYLVLYVDDFVYFSADDEVERYFESALSQKIKLILWVRQSGFW